MTLTQLKSAADALPADERQELTDYLVDQSAGEMPDDIKAEWLAVARQRLDEMVTGKVQGIPGDVFQKELKERAR